MSKARRRHPYLVGNFAPVRTTLAAETCHFEGTIPEEFLGGQYVRNGTNPLQSEAQRDFHWFDGDGMLTGVYFKRIPESPSVQPVFTNQYVLTDMYCATVRNRRLCPIIPSVATMTNPALSTLRILLEVTRSTILIFASIWGLVARPIRRVSSANTSILHHDGRVLATNEVGPPMRVFLPLLQTVGWFTGNTAEGEPGDCERSKPYFGGPGMEGFYKEMTTAHPKVDLHTGELLLFHSTFLPPFVHYSIVPARSSLSPEPHLNQPVPGLTSGKMMHDFGVSPQHTIIIDLPLSLDPSNIFYGKPVMQYDPHGQTRIGVFPRHFPDLIRWFKTAACVVMHTVNSWDEETPRGVQVNMLLCRMNSVAPLYHMGNLDAPGAVNPPDPECRLYYYQFPPSQEGSSSISQQWALSAIPFEFPCVPKHLEMKQARFVYGCSMRNGNFATSHISSYKIDCLVKMDVQHLLLQAKSDPPSPVYGCVDKRSIADILASKNRDDPIRAFAFPSGWYAQECSFVPRRDGKSEDDGWLVTYVFNESQLDENGDAPPSSHSELWVIDAVRMTDVVCRVVLPQRVPYGMHGNWFPEEQIVNQRYVREFRSK
ncbi:carotenoid oxygenase family protein [Aspergillus ibericus CBS 121593]|uniref:9-cis-epoxycarotenoid dioxygenase n=1 Tax=Aspergillus ibericus CBS 121593 TaxID=1448316 RepID=A0A395H8Y1_9EURO|nr:9-cis-epoxycarotenoid dioxygenase [Aspergillus ibericus CBS 121593]RAL04302.1 9-cis-epoxycarotenoid dioxygenase [Aspergillus ibericus CBS 121593]